MGKDNVIYSPASSDGNTFYVQCLLKIYYGDKVCTCSTQKYLKSGVKNILQ